MYEKEVVVTTKYGKMPSFVACPEGPGPFPGIIFYMDAPGIREELRNMTRRIARHGYFAILPDMYYRLGSLRFDIPRRDDGMAAVFLGAMNSLTNAMVMDDTGGLLGYMDGQDKCKPGPVGCVGYCMSGQHITNAAALYPHRIKAAASPLRRARHHHRQGEIRRTCIPGQDQGRALTTPSPKTDRQRAAEYPRRPRPS